MGDDLARCLIQFNAVRQVNIQGLTLCEMWVDASMGCYLCHHDQ